MSTMGPGSQSRLKSRFGVLALLIVLLLIGFLLINAINPVGTSRAVVSTAQWWSGHWPVKMGRTAGYRLNDALYRIGVFKPVVTQIRPGVIMELDGRDLVTQSILMQGVWEPKVTAFVSSSLAPGNVFIDVGAHVGYYSLLAAPLVGPTGKVVAVEPNPPTIARLERNINLNQNTNVLVQKVACTDKEETLKFFQAPTENTGGSSMFDANPGKETEIQVAAVPLDKIVQSLALSRVDLVKIDVEGAELLVLRGMKGILANYRPKLSIELQGPNVTAAEALIHDSGYTLVGRDGVGDYFWAPTSQAPQSH